MRNLTLKKCVPCESGTPPLQEGQIKELHKEISDWEVSEDNKKISRNFEFRDFTKAMSFINKVADLAEDEGHHPDMLIYSWNKVKIELWTHAIGGLSDNDFIMAAKIDTLL